jgi:hypothetical protein
LSNRTILATGLVNLFFPIGDTTINSTVLNSPSPYTLFVYFDISARDQYDRVVITRLFAQALITPDSLIRACDEFKVVMLFFQFT